jgi:hypothetical protein
VNVRREGCRSGRVGKRGRRQRERRVRGGLATSQRSGEVVCGNGLATSQRSGEVVCGNGLATSQRSGEVVCGSGPGYPWGGGAEVPLDQWELHVGGTEGTWLYLTGGKRLDDSRKVGVAP